jgi:hypothetical protein
MIYTLQHYRVDLTLAFFLSAEALTVGWEMCVRVAVSGVGECCRRRLLLLKYIIYEILHRKVRKVKGTISLRTLRSLR